MGQSRLASGAVIRRGVIAWEVAECELLPRGYGVAWWYVHKKSAICLPCGLHLIIGAARNAYVWFVTRRTPDAIERAYRLGLQDGRRSAELSFARRLQSAEQDAFERGMLAEQLSVGIREEITALRVEIGHA